MLSGRAWEMRLWFPHWFHSGQALNRVCMQPTSNGSGKPDTRTLRLPGSAGKQNYGAAQHRVFSTCILCRHSWWQWTEALYSSGDGISSRAILRITEFSLKLPRTVSCQCIYATFLTHPSRIIPQVCICKSDLTIQICSVWSTTVTSILNYEKAWDESGMSNVLTKNVCNTFACMYGGAYHADLSPQRTEKESGWFYLTESVW